MELVTQAEQAAEKHDINDVNKHKLTHTPKSKNNTGYILTSTQEEMES